MKKYAAWGLAAISVTLAVSVFVYADHALGKALDSISEVRIGEIAAKQINEAVAETLDTRGSEDFLVCRTEESGEISAVSANTAYMNRYTVLVTDAIHSKIGEMQGERIMIPIGAILGSRIMEQIGPEIPLKIKPVGGVSVNLYTDFESAGINQTKYRAILKVEGKAKPVIPFSAKPVDYCSVIPLAEIVVVGNVPRTYLSLP